MLAVHVPVKVLGLEVNNRREREAWRLAILFRGFVWTWTQRISFAGEGIGTSGMERLRQFLRPASERKGILLLSAYTQTLDQGAATGLDPDQLL
jgi:hypothetical protein